MFTIVRTMLIAAFAASMLAACVGTKGDTDNRLKKDFFSFYGESGGR